MAEQAPGMEPFLKRVVKQMSVATTDDNCKTGSKKSVAERDETRKAKKANTQEDAIRNVQTEFSDSGSDLVTSPHRSHLLPFHCVTLEFVIICN